MLDLEKGNETLADLQASSEFADVTLRQVLDAMTLETLYGEGTLSDIEDPGSLTLGQLLIAMMIEFVSRPDIRPPILKSGSVIVSRAFGA